MSFTLQKFFSAVDERFADNTAGGIDAADMRESLKDISLLLQEAVTDKASLLNGLLDPAQQLRAWGNVRDYNGALTTVSISNGDTYNYVADSTLPLIGRAIIPADGKGAGQWILDKAEYSAKDFGVKGDGVTDDTAAIGKALSGVLPGVIFFPKGTYMVSAPTQAADNVSIRFDKQAVLKAITHFAAFKIGGNDARYVLLPGNNNKLNGVNIDNRNLKVGGICNINVSDVLVENCTVSNWRDTLLFGIADIGASGIRYSKSTCTNGFHGFHSYRSSRVTMAEVVSRKMKGGGIYTAWSYKVSVIGAIIEDCEDVGIDFENGVLCTNSFSTVSRCRNGELAIFSGNNEFNTIGHHLIHQNCTVHRQAVYTAMADTIDSNGTVTATAETEMPVDTTLGAMVFMSTAAGCYEVGYKDNQVVVNAGAGWGIIHQQLGNSDRDDRSIFCTGNTVRSAAGFFRILNNVGFRFTDNKFYGKPGSEAIQNEFRDASGAEIARNTFRYDLTKTSGYALLLNTNTQVSVNGATTPWATKPSYVGYNVFINAGALALKVDLFNNPNLKPTLHRNDLGTEYTANGGLSITSNGDAILKDQPLKLRLEKGDTQFSGIDGINRAGIAKASGHLGFGRVGYNGLLASVQIIKGSGNIDVASTTQIPAGGMSVTPSQGKLTLAADSVPTGSGVSAYLDLTVNTY